MNGEDGLRNGDGSSAVRILPPDGSAPIEPPAPSQSPQPRRLAPLIAVVALAGVFAVSTLPSGPEPTVPTTQPAPIAAVEAELIDLRPVPGPEKISEWMTVDIEGHATILSVVRAGNSLVAAGYTPDGAQLWISGTGASWREVERLELPEGAETTINHVVSLGGDLFALGSVDGKVGLWAADVVSTWRYEGVIEAMGSSRIHHVAAGPTLLAISPSEDRMEGWVSADGYSWVSQGVLSDLDDLTLVNLIATEGWFFAVGTQKCDVEECGSAIYRSADGHNWEPVHGRNEPGVITDMTATSTGYLATGTERVAGGTGVTVWESEDGASWHQIALGDAALAPARVTIQLESARAGANPWAELRVDDDLWDVTEGTIIETAAGTLEITSVRDGSIWWTDGVNITPLGIGETTSMTAQGYAGTITAEGPRVVIAGTVERARAPRPTVWASDDLGVNWARIDLPGGSGTAYTPITTGRNLVVLGSTRDSQAIWRGSWSTEVATRSAEAHLASFVAALNQQNADWLIELLPPTDTGPAQPSFMVPSLGRRIHTWWDEETGDLVPQRIVDTVDYLAATATSLEMGECTSGATFGVADRVNLRCEITVDSTLLSLFGSEGGQGAITALVRNGTLSSVHLDEDPSVNLWRILSTHLAGSKVTDTSTPIVDDVSNLEFNAATAAEHTALASTVLGGLLSPGVTTTVETIFGTMKWSWLTEIGIDADYVGSLAWTDLGFFAAGYRQVGGSDPEFGIWNSADGMSWVEVPLPEALESVWGLRRYQDGLVGQAYGSDTPMVVFYDGSDWTLVPIATSDSETLGGVWLTVSGDTVYGILGGSDFTGFTISQAFVIGPDLVSRPAGLPPVDSWEGYGFDLTGSEAGFALAITNQAVPSEMTIWFSENGQHWTSLAEAQQLGEARYLHQIQHHGSHYFVVGQAAEVWCSAESQGRDCVYLNNLWRSPDGIVWDRVVTDTGQAVATYSIGSGPLGVLAFGQETFQGSYPRPVYFSIDGISWTTRGGPTLLAPDSDWWWIEPPVMSEDTILAMGSSYNDVDSSDTLFMIVGRLLDN